MTAKRVLGAILAGVLLILTGCASSDSDSADATRPVVTSTTPAPDGAAAMDFREVSYRISTTAALRCALLAESALERATGLMNRTDLAGHDGMLFVFEEDTTGGFWMKDTPLPLSIAWFDSEGRFVSSADMEPCLGRGSDCPNYSAARAYRYALEVPQGGLAPLGIRPGAVLSVGGPCP